MLRRNFLFVAFLVLSVTVLFSGDSLAGVSLSGFSFNWGSINCLSILKALSKNDARSTTVACEVAIVEANLQCVNKGGNADTANATKFQPQDVTVGASVSANSCSLEKSTGRWFCTDPISNAAIESALGIAPDSPIGLQCGPNRNFSSRLDVITKMCAKIDIRDATGLSLDSGFAQCTLEPHSPSGTPFSCTEISSTQFETCSIDDF